MIEVLTERKPHFGNYRIFYVPEENGKFATYIEAKDSKDELSDWMELFGLITWPPHRRKGYASAVLDAAYRYVLNQNKGAFLYVTIDNKDAISLYTKKGFKIICPYSVRRFYQSQDYIHQYIMAKNEFGNTQDLFEYFYKLNLDSSPDGCLLP